MSVGFDPASVAWASRSGSATIQGEAFLRQMGGGVVTAAGETVYLCPDSPYDQEINATSVWQRRAPVDDPSYAAYIETCRTTIASADGSFVFGGLPAGTYSVGTRVIWFVGTSFIPEGGYVYQPVTVRSGESVRVVLSR
jgi:hypothetical protein